MSGSPTIQVNGEARQFAAGTLAGVLEAEAVNLQAVNPQAVNSQAVNSGAVNSQAVNSGARGLAVAVNGQVVPRHAWGATQIAPGDEIEIVKLFAGG